MIAAWTARIIGLPKWAKQALAGLGIALALWLAWTLYIGHVRREAVAKHEAEQAAQIAAQREAANDRAAETARINAVTNAQADARNADAIARAQASDPAGVKRQAGPATRAVLEGLR